MTGFKRGNLIRFKDVVFRDIGRSERVLPLFPVDDTDETRFMPLSVAQETTFSFLRAESYLMVSGDHEIDCCKIFVANGEELLYLFIAEPLSEVGDEHMEKVL